MLTWQPQSRVDLALLVSLVAIIACIVLALLPARRRRRVVRHAAHGAHSHPAEPDEENDLAATEALTEGVRLAVPFAAESPRAPSGWPCSPGCSPGLPGQPSRRRRSASGPGWPASSSYWCPRLRVLLGLAAIAGIVCRRLLHRHPPGRPAHSRRRVVAAFQKASRLAWVGVVLLGADAVVEVVLGRRRSSRH